jgi:deazaflavin-dependent oxidoreductase (nitroreductase family)
MSDRNDFNELNIAEFRANHGRVSGPFEGAPLVVLHTVGARSGKPRTNIMMYLADGGRYLVFASNNGADDNPAWYWNLKAHPDARIEVGDDIVEVLATELQGAERDDKYALQAQRYPGFAEYERKTPRTIPVVALTPTDGSQESSGSRHIDFDALYRGESPGEGIAPMTTPPWDNKAPSESVIGWQTRGWIRGDVLDIGCGLGDNAVYLAKNGHTVTGLDISPTALITAEQRANDAGVDVTFAVADSTKLDGYTDAFDTVIDSGMFHSLDDEGRRSYAAAVHRATRPGATLLLSCFSYANPVGDEWPRPAVSEETLRDVLGGAGWDIASLEPATVRGAPDGAQVDMAFWYVRAQRRDPS